MRATQCSASARVAVAATVSRGAGGGHSVHPGTLQARADSGWHGAQPADCRQDTVTGGAVCASDGETVEWEYWGLA